MKFIMTNIEDEKGDEELEKGSLRAKEEYGMGGDNHEWEDANEGADGQEIKRS